MKTNTEYINEFSLCDQVIETLESVERDLVAASYKYETKCRQLDLNSFFAESNEYDLILEQEQDGFLAKIGKAVIQIVEAIANFIRDIGAKITGNAKESRDVNDVVNKMIIEHPELKDEIVKGINKNWYTMRDVASFEKDIIGLTNMLKQKAIDHKTFKEKLGDRCKAFSNSAAPILNGAATAGAIIGLPAVLHKKATASKDSLSKLQKVFKETSEMYEKNRDVHGANAFSSFVNAFGNALGLVTKECADREASQSGLCKFLSKITFGAVDIKRSDSDKADYQSKRDKQLEKYVKKRAEREKAEKDRKDKEDKTEQMINDVLRAIGNNI